ncbi:hypothetical protein [Paenibacillus sp. YAF4_2]|uniref:hypothetical protein n=1 Tax=Paenibacillus sp. YAF4_2 TaxID=3233085 RepID=UPI003F974DA6
MVFGLSKMKNKILQFGGSGNTSYIDNRQLTVVNTMHEQFARMKMNGDYEGIAKFMLDFSRQIETTHPLYPDYRYKVQETSRGLFFYHEPLNPDAAERLPLSYNISLRVKKDAHSGNKSLGELFQTAMIRQQNIEIDVLSLQALIGGRPVDTPLLQDHIEGNEWVIAPPERPEPLKLSLIVTTQSGDTETILPYIELGITDLDEEFKCYVLNNNRQIRAKIFIEMRIPMEWSYDEYGRARGTSNLKLKINPLFEKDVEANFRFLKFFNHSESAEKITFMNLETNSYFFVADRFQLEPVSSDLGENLRILEQLYALEQYFNVQFCLPNDKMTADDRKNIKILDCIRTKNPIKFVINDIKLQVEGKQGLKNLFEKVKDGKINGLSLVQEKDGSYGLDVLGTRVSLPFLKDEIVPKELRVKNINALRRKLESTADDEVVPIELIPLGDREVQQWYRLP